MSTVTGQRSSGHHSQSGTKLFLIATIIRVLLNQRPFELEGALVQTLHFIDEQTKSQRRL